MPSFVFSFLSPLLSFFILLFIVALCMPLPLSVYVQGGYTALEVASAEGRIATAQILVEAGARLNALVRSKESKAPIISRTEEYIEDRGGVG